jgi:hypothetical protein
MTTRRQLQDEYTVMVTPAHLAEAGHTFTIPLCGLCGNSGKLDMKVPYDNLLPDHPEVRLKAFCLCDNGRASRRRDRRERRKAEMKPTPSTIKESPA